MKIQPFLSLASVHQDRAIRRVLVLCLLIPSMVAAGPFFDVHLHYSAEDAEVFSPSDIIQKLDQSLVRFAAVTGSPPEHVVDLAKFAPDRIVPLLSVYRRHGDKESWTKDQTLPEFVKKQLQHGGWRGIGELHIFAADRHSAVFRSIVELAARNHLPLMLHADPAVIDRLYEINPGQKVIWAHAGTFPHPELLADYLQRYPALSVDVSMRDGRIAPGGTLADDWYELFMTYPGRFLVGVDTFSTQRWHDFDSANQIIRQWLRQLPDDIAQQIAFQNAATFFSVEQ